MVRLSAIFIAFCMLLIAMSIGAVLFLAFDLSGPQSAIVAIIAMTALALSDAVAKELRSRRMIGEQIANLSRGTADLAWQVGDLTRQVAEASRRITAIERKTEIPLERTRAAIPAINTEIDELGGIVKQLAEAVAAHETRFTTEHTITEHTIAAEQPALQMFSEPAPTTDVAQPEIRIELDGPEPDAPLNLSPASAPESHDAMIAMIRGVLDANRADIYMQPIVSLPQRKIRYYEAFTRLRGEDGELLLPIDFILAAERGGLMPRIDLSIVTRAAQVVRRLLQKNRDVGIICNISAYTLIDRKACRQLQDFMQANRELASSLLLEFPQSVWRTMSPFEQDSVAELAQLGVGFSMDHVADLRMEPQEMAKKGIRLVKVPAKLLIEGKPDMDIHPTDLANLLARYDIGLIAERIEAENTVLELFDYDVRFGQGFLFSAPRPVRAEALQELTDENASTEQKAPIAEPNITTKPATVRRKIAKAVEEIGRTGILPKPAPGGSKA
jgi:cyclic-di-GMP phosphodiesterase, flagellum assembly factor TipF